MSDGTLVHVAPEGLNRSRTSQCNLWSLGVVTFVLLLGCMPFHGSEDAQIERLASGKPFYGSEGR